MTALVVQGDARHLPLPDGSVDLICTSPPYFALRSYTDAGQHYAGQIGSEATPAEYLDALWACTREWMRVLKPEGSIFVNLGDKYGGRGGGVQGVTSQRQGRVNAAVQARGGYLAGDKSLLGIPWRYAIGCIDQLGLILRAEIIWSKSNGLPESVTDRVRRSHEQWFHFTKQPRYYAAVDEIREGHKYPLTPAEMASRLRGSKNGVIHGNNRGSNRGDKRNSAEDLADVTGSNPLGKLPGSVWSIPSEPLQVPDTVGVDHFAAFPTEWPRRLILGWSPPGICTACGQGRRPVSERGEPILRAWSAAGAQYRGGGQNGSTLKHLVPRDITGYACACTPYTDHPGSGESSNRRVSNPYGEPGREQGVYSNKAGEYERVGPWREYHSDRWTPPPTTPALIVDPFGGTGTVALVAHALGRVGVSVDMSGDYTRLARWRCTDRGELAKAMRVPKPAPVPLGQMEMFA